MEMRKLASFIGALSKVRHRFVNNGNKATPSLSTKQSLLSNEVKLYLV